MFFLHFTQKIKKKKIMKLVEENQSISEKLESYMSTNNMNFVINIKPSQRQLTFRLAIGTVFFKQRI